MSNSQQRKPGQQSFGNTMYNSNGSGQKQIIKKSQIDITNGSGGNGSGLTTGGSNHTGAGMKVHSRN